MKVRKIPTRFALGMTRCGNDNKEAGQATVEFALMMGIVFFLLFMIFQAGVTYMTTQYIKYAAYMGARTFAVKGADGEAAGRYVIESYLGRNGGKLKPFIRTIPNTDFIQTFNSDDGKEVGFRINYRSLFYFPFIGQGVASDGNPDAEPAREFLELNVNSRMKNENFECAPEKTDNRTGLSGC